MISKEEQNYRHVIAIVGYIDGVKLNQAGIVTNESEEQYEVRFIGNDITRTVYPIQVKDIDVFETGKKRKACSNKDECPNWRFKANSRRKRGRKRGCQCYQKKICITCGVLKDRQIDFSQNRVGAKERPTYRPHCKNCYSEKEGISVSQEAREKEIAKISDGDLFKCPICEKIGLANINVKIVIDHDHKTGKIRGAICDKCNTGLGRWDDDPETFSRASKWLKGK